MKTIKKANRVILTTVLLIATFSFSILQTTKKSDLIIGTWVNMESPGWKLEFRSDGMCYDYLNGKISEISTYSISEEKSINGKLTHSFLKLTNVNDSDDIYEYEINGLGVNKLTLAWLERPGNLMYFEKE